MRFKTIVALVVLSALGLWAATSVIGATDDRQEGTVTKTEALPGGGQDIYREQEDGEVVIEHQEPDGSVWFESNEILGADGEPIVCPDGTPLRADFEVEEREPDPKELEKASRGLPDNKTVVFNEYTGEFEVAEAARVQVKTGVSAVVTAGEPFVYKCDPQNEPTLVPLSEVDPEAGAEARKEARKRLTRITRNGGDSLTGLGGSELPQESVQRDDHSDSGSHSHP